MSCGGTGTLAIEPVKAFVTLVVTGSSIKTRRLQKFDLSVCLQKEQTIKPGIVFFQLVALNMYEQPRI